MITETLQELAGRHALPQRMGLAQLRFELTDRREGSYKGPHTERKGDTITIVAHRMSRLIYGLQNGLQCVLVSPPPKAQMTHPVDSLFAGQDENPFLSWIDWEAAAILATQGEPAFYQSLKPDKIARLERAWNTSARRQGDIWAIKTPYTKWKEIENASLMAYAKKPVRREPNLHHNPDGGIPIFRTAHKVYGESAAHIHWGEAEFARGVLRQQPDHADLRIDDAYYFLMRSAHLAKGSSGD